MGERFTPDWSLLPPNIGYVYWDGENWRGTTMRPVWNGERGLFEPEEFAEVLSRPLPAVVVGKLPIPTNARTSLYVR